MKIKNVQWGGFLDFRRVHPDNWEKTRTEMEQVHRYILPPWEDLPEDGREDLRLLLSPIFVAIETKKYGVLVYDVQPGILTDFASVPEFLRGILDNDSLELLLAALIHDLNFKGHFLSFNAANSIFTQMVRKPGGGSWWTAKKASWGVNNFIAEKVYYDATATQIKDTRKRVNFDWGPKKARG